MRSLILHPRHHKHAIFQKEMKMMPLTFLEIWNITVIFSCNETCVLKEKGTSSFHTESYNRCVLLYEKQTWTTHLRIGAVHMTKAFPRYQKYCISHSDDTAWKGFGSYSALSVYQYFFIFMVIRYWGSNVSGKSLINFGAVFNFFSPHIGFGLCSLRASLHCCTTSSLFLPVQVVDAVCIILVVPD